eukprot:6516763-Prymnesium_polylepis.1
MNLSAIDRCDRLAVKLWASAKPSGGGMGHLASLTALGPADQPSWRSKALAGGRAACHAISSCTRWRRKTYVGARFGTCFACLP